MPQLKFFVTQTKLDLAKFSNVVSGYTMVENCASHASKNTKANPRLQFIQELVIKNKQYPAALLRPWGYCATHESVLGEYPRRSIFYYKNHLSEFQSIREAFDAAPENTQFVWSCGCRIRKYTTAELIELCNQPWYPWVGDREPALFTYGEVWKRKRLLETPRQIATALLADGAIDVSQVNGVVRSLESHLD